ncbi:myotubularin-related protein 3 isoform X1 [Tachysurus ichikawai]
MLWSAVYLPNSAPSLLCDESCASYSTASASPEDTPPGRLPKTRSYDHLLTACEGTNLSASNRRCSDPNLNETWQEHLRSEARTAETQPKENIEEAECFNTHHPEMTGLDSKLPNDGLVNGVEHSDSKIENGIISVNQGGEASPVVSTACLNELSNEVPKQNGEDSACDEVLRLSPRESVASSTPHPGHGTNSQECLSPEEPLCLANNLKYHPASPHEESTEPFNMPCSLHSPSQSLSPKLISDSYVCNSEDLRINGSVSQRSLSRQTSVASAGSLQLGCPGRTPAQSAHLGEDGLSIHRDAVQVRLRQMEAGHQLQVETLKRQVQALWNELHVSGELTPVPDGENNVEAVHLSHCGTELFPESSWENEDQHDKQVSRWYSEHLPTHCYRCESKFWLAARKQQCSAREPVEEAWNCGNVFCASCCDHKATNQPLYEPNRVCQACYGHLRPSAVPPVLPPADLELEKPITASFN